MANPYTDRMNEIARLRNRKMIVESQMGDEIAKAWRLSPTSNLETFAQTLGMEVSEVQEILRARGIVVRTQPTAPGAEV